MYYLQQQSDTLVSDQLVLDKLKTEVRQEETSLGNKTYVTIYS
jgi:hypothetical protein